MKRRIYPLVIATSLMLCLAGCGKEKKPDSDAGITALEPDRKFTESTVDFSIRLLQTDGQDAISSGKNVLISPESVTTALAMTTNGADNETKDQLYQAICPGLTQDEVNSYLYSFNNQISDSEDISFNIANSIWINDEMPIEVREDFITTGREYFNSEIYKSPFSDGIQDKVNSWCDEKTNHMIPKILNTAPTDTVLMLVNAIAFDGEWEDPYEDNQIKEGCTFTSYNGTKQTVTMLSSNESYYLSDDSCTGVIKNYKGRDFAFMALLPNEDIDMQDFVNDMTADSFISLFNNKTSEEVITQIPEFTYDYDTDLVNSFKQMGVTDAFDPDTADFSKMVTDTDFKIFIGSIVHKTHIELDRNGTKASATTIVTEKSEAGPSPENQPKRVILDRPFVYAIIDTRTGIPIFLGVLNTMQ